MLTLMLMRHGKSDWNAGAATDHARPLNGRGRLFAETMGTVLREMKIVPDLVVCSTAMRARSTAEIARISGGWPSRLILDDDLYGAGVGDTLLVAARHGGNASRLMLVGHQPTWSMTVRHLTGDHVDIRTATVAIIELPIDGWLDIGKTKGTLVDVLEPRDFIKQSGSQDHSREAEPESTDKGQDDR